MKKKKMKKELKKLNRELSNRIMLDEWEDELDEAIAVVKHIENGINKLQEKIYG